MPLPAVKQFARSGSEVSMPVTREFCAECGTHLVTLVDGMPDAVFLKAGTLDNPSLFGGPDLAVFTVDQQSFHQVPRGIPAFERMPGYCDLAGPTSAGRTNCGRSARQISARPLRPILSLAEADHRTS